ncbi:hypothetical protein HY494_00600 [Candidatus Woesearchaeota archaeon]|nr:hypothetical protein [Candidatus Woesearchaeota archaeon]
MPWQNDKGVDVAEPSDPLFKSLVKKDLMEALRGGELALDERLREPLLVQTVLGHAQEGHKAFQEGGIKYPSATVANIIEAAGLEVSKIKNIRQEVIDQVFEWVELAKKDQTNLLVIGGQPLLGIEFLRNYQINPEFVLKGMILAGMMDNYGWRQATIKRYGGKTIHDRQLKIGGGETHLIDARILRQEKPFFLEDLAEKEISDETINDLRTKGIITAAGNPHAEVAYIRRKKGLGTSDDTAFIFMGEMYKKEGWEKSLSAFLGGFIVDGIDTYDKCTARPVEGGYDERLGMEIRTALPSLVSDDEITALIYYSAKSNGQEVVSSSHKRLIQMVANADPKIPTLLHHHKFMDTGKFASYRVGFERMPSKLFYNAVRERIDHYHQSHQSH